MFTEFRLDVENKKERWLEKAKLMAQVIMKGH